MSARRPRVLVVDDSAFARTVLARVLSASCDVVGTAREGRDALEQIAAHDPDVITLDLTMPDIDGIGVLRALAGKRRPRAIVVSISSVDTELGAEALALGAIDIIAKPTALASDRLNEISSELLAKVHAAAAGYIAPPPAPPVPPATRMRTSDIELVMIGTSTGGPQALTRIITALPGDLPAPVVIALHIPAGYTQALAARLDKNSALQVVEGMDGLILQPGMVVLAPGGKHLLVNRVGDHLVSRLSTADSGLYMPSVDELFLSGAAAARGRTLGVVLTGMGQDGLVGARAIAAAGGALMVEDPSTCVVYGMPRSVHEANLGADVVTLDRMAEEIARRV